MDFIKAEIEHVHTLEICFPSLHRKNQSIVFSKFVICASLCFLWTSFFLLHQMGFKRTEKNPKASLSLSIYLYVILLISFNLCYNIKNIQMISISNIESVLRSSWMLPGNHLKSCGLFHIQKYQQPSKHKKYWTCTFVFWKHLGTGENSGLPGWIQTLKCFIDVEK